MWLLLRFRWSAHMRNLAERITRFRPLQTALYWIQFIVLSAVLTFPMTVYEGYFREHKYDLLNQTFGPWMRDQLVGAGGRRGAGSDPGDTAVRTGAATGKELVGVGRGPDDRVFCVREPDRSGLHFSAVQQVQESGGCASQGSNPQHGARQRNSRHRTSTNSTRREQSNRVSANVSGFANTLRISLNDNLLKRCTLPEIETTMGHEMGHYVLNHAYKGLVMIGVVIVIGFAFLNWGINFRLARWGEAWDIRGITDVAVLPLAVIVFSLFFFVTTPVTNTITRTMEFEADMYGLNAARQPDGEANVDMLLGEYRKLDPSPLEEFIFFDHPSGRTRITAAMRWKAEHPETASPEEMARPIFEAEWNAAHGGVGHSDPRYRQRAYAGENPHPLPDTLQHPQRLLQLFLRVRRGHDGADAGFAFRHGGECDAGAEHAFFEQLAGEVHGELAVADDDRRDRSFAGRSGAAADVEAEQAEFFFPEARVLPELFHALGLVFQNVEGRDAGGRHRRRMRRREQERPRAVIEKIDQIARAADVSAERADRLRQRADLNIDAAVHVEVIDGAAAVAAQHAGGVRVVDHHDGAVFFGQVAQARAAGRCRRPWRRRRR